jgi:hypothetical protein
MRGEARFREWVAVATHGLPEETALVVGEELESHYEDAVQDHLARGKSGEEARAAALTDLGDARQVGRALRRIHLSPVGRLRLALLRMRTLFRQMIAAQRAPGAFPAFDMVGALLFGLWVLVVANVPGGRQILGDSGLSPVTPVALAFVLLGLLLEGRVAPWNYPAFGWLITSGSWWLLFPVTLLREEPGPGRESTLFWDTIVPLLPLFVLLLVCFLIVRRLRREEAFCIPSHGWRILGLLLLVHLLWIALPLASMESWDRSLLGLLTHVAGYIPLILLVVGSLLLPIFIGLLGAHRDGLVALLIPLASFYVFIVEDLDLSYRVDFYAYWEPTPALRLAQYSARYLPAISAFFVTSLGLLSAKSKRGKALAAALPWTITLVGFEILAGFALGHTPRAYALADWLHTGINVLQYYLLPLAFTIVLYGQFEGRAREPELEDLSPSGPVLRV